MKKNLSILVYSLAGGGAERVVSILLDELKSDYYITLVLMNNTIVYKIPKGQKVVYLENSNPFEVGLLKFFKLPFLGLKYKKICKENDIHVSISFMNRPNYINSISKILGNKSKIIISERSTPSLLHKNGLQGFINRFLIKKLYPTADIVTANSQGNSFDLINYFDLKKITTINNPIDIKKIEKQSKYITELKSGSFNFITVGRLDSGKNHKLIVEVMKDIANVHFDAKLYIIGNGVLKQTIENQIKELDLENKIILLGYQENPYKYLVKADCFVFSSSYEGFPNVLLEAMVCELPIISTDCQSGPREILSPNSDINFQLKENIEKVEYGILTPVNDKENLIQAMNLMIKDNELRDNYKQKTKSRVNNFNKDKIINEWIKVIDN